MFRSQLNAYRCSSTSRGVEEEIQRVAGRIQGAIQVHPLPADLDVGLVNAPGIIGSFQIRPASFIYFWGIRLHPAIDGRVHDRQSPFGHHFFYISIAERVPQVPTTTTKYRKQSTRTSLSTQVCHPPKSSFLRLSGRNRPSTPYKLLYAMHYRSPRFPRLSNGYQCALAE
jgi:hypothetical protein